jgi:hypothetical protein
MYNNDPKYTDPPEAGLASLLASRGQGGDSMVVHMAPEEVSGLQQLARSMGAQESDLYNPVTGQPQFSFLKKILPMVAGAILGPAGFGMSAFKTALTVGGITGLLEGDLKKGLMAGLGAYSGAGISGGLKKAAEVGTTSVPDSTVTTEAAGAATSRMAPTALKDNILYGGAAPKTFDIDPTRAANWSAATASPVNAGDIVQTVTQREPPTGFLQTMGRGVQNAFGTKEGAQAFMSGLSGGATSPFGQALGKYATIAGAMIPFAEEPKPISVPGMGEDIVYIPGGFNPQYGTGVGQPYQLPGRYYKRTSKGLTPYNPYQMAPGTRGFAEGGAVDKKPEEDPNVVANRRYVEELNRRAMNPVNNPYGMNFAGGLGGTNAPYTGGTPYGNWPTGGGDTGGSAGGGGAADVAMNLAAMYGVQKGIGSLMGTPYAQSLIAGAKSALGLGGAGALTGVTPTGLVPGTTAYNAAMAAKAGTGAATGATGTGAATTGTGAAGSGTGTAGASVLKGGATPLGTAAAAAAALYGAQQAYQGIKKGKEGQAAGGGALAGAGGAYLAGASGLGGAGLTSLAGFGPVGLAAAAIAAIGASLVNTKEQGDVALRNYWKAVDQGRGIGSAPPEELANGFINFYRTNKNEFAGQEKYGRKGNEDFVYDMTQVVNKAVQDGKVSKDATPEEIYRKAVQPWLNSMGSGPKDADARRIQDFMMTDLIYNFMQGKPISNAQVKGDKKFKIVSERPVYAGNVPAGAQQIQQASTQGRRQNMDPAALANYLQTQNPYGPTMNFADGGSVGEDYNFGFADGGMPEYKAGGKLLDGPGDGMSDSIPAVIRGKGVQRAALADGEFVVPADVVSHLGNGSTKAGAKKLYQMMAQVRKARTGKTRQAPAVKTDRLLPA